MTDQQIVETEVMKNLENKYKTLFEYRKEHNAILARHKFLEDSFKEAKEEVSLIYKTLEESYEDDNFKVTYSTSKRVSPDLLKSEMPNDWEKYCVLSQTVTITPKY